MMSLSMMSISREKISKDKQGFIEWVIDCFGRDPKRSSSCFKVAVALTSLA